MQGSEGIHETPFAELDVTTRPAKLRLQPKTKRARFPSQYPNKGVRSRSNATREASPLALRREKRDTRCLKLLVCLRQSAPSLITSGPREALFIPQHSPDCGSAQFRGSACLLIGAPRCVPSPETTGEEEEEPPPAPQQNCNCQSCCYQSWTRTVKPF